MNDGSASVTPPPVRPPDSLLWSVVGPALRVIARRRLGVLAQQHVAAAQEQVLLRLVHKAQNTRFGRDHDFARIRSIADFQRQVPLRRYDDFWREYWKPSFPRARDCTWPGLAPFYAMSSGTSTGLNKYIPTTHELIHTNAQMVRDVLAHHLANHPGTRVLRGKVFALGGTTELTREAPGVESGDLSGIELREIGWPMRRWFFPPVSMSAIADYESKITTLAEASLQEDIRMILGPPNWLLVYFDRLLKLRPGVTRLVDIFPHLELIVHGGMAFGPYRQRFLRLIEGSHAELREVYAASEGFFAVADRGNGEGLRLVVDSGIFYELVPVSELGSRDPTRHWLGNAEPGVEYALAICNPAGAWAYLIGDTVRLVEKDPARVLVTGRTSYVLTPFGEHVIHDQLEDAIGRASRAARIEVAEYTVGPIFPAEGSPVGGHLLIVESVGAAPSPEALRTFGQVLDERLVALNEDYARRRANDLGMLPPEIIGVPPGTFYEWLQREGRLGGQIKVPRVLNDRAILDRIESVAVDCGGVRVRLPARAQAAE